MKRYLASIALLAGLCLTPAASADDSSAVLGIGGDEVVHTFLEIMAAGTPYTTMARAVHLHPTVSEYLPTLLGNLDPLA